MQTFKDRQPTQKYDGLCHDVKNKLHAHDQETGYRHFCVLLRKNQKCWEGKDRSWF